MLGSMAVPSAESRAKAPVQGVWGVGIPSSWKFFGGISIATICIS